MTHSTDTAHKRPVILYIIIATVLSAALVFGVWWAKNRADYYAQQTGEASQPQGEPTPDEIASQAREQSQGQAETTPPPAPTMTQPESSLPVSVPAAGPEQGLLSIAAICAFIFAGLSYIRARKRLFAYKTFTL